MVRKKFMSFVCRALIRRCRGVELLFGKGATAEPNVVADVRFFLCMHA